MPELGRKIVCVCARDHLLGGEAVKHRTDKKSEWSLDCSGHIWNCKQFAAWCYSEEFAALLPSWVKR